MPIAPSSCIRDRDRSGYPAATQGARSNSEEPGPEASPKISKTLCFIVSPGLVS